MARLFLLLCLGAWPAWAMAQDASAPRIRSDVNGLLLGAYAGWTALVVEGGDAEQGWGGTVRAGYGFFSAAVLYAGVDAMKVDNRGALPAPFEENPTYGLTHFDLGLQLHLASRRSAIVPYLDAAFSGRSAVFADGDADLTISGLATTLGGGIKLFLHPAIALDAGGRYAFGPFDRREVGSDATDVDINAQSVRFFAGLSLYPFR